MVLAWPAHLRPHSPNLTSSRDGSPAIPSTAASHWRNHATAPTHRARIFRANIGTILVSRPHRIRNSTAAIERSAGRRRLKGRIAHFDTGYDPNHHTLPKRLRADIARNFVDDGNPNDASDQTSGLLTNLGHGTGTLSILAGHGKPGSSRCSAVRRLRKSCRCASPTASCCSATARSRRRSTMCTGSNAAGANRVDIITMSMGGLASQAWADAVNALYEQGVFIVTAAGNNFGNLPTHNIVYPARFDRVVAACGVMANGKPYADLGIRLMAGNYGPDSKMKTAIAAPTPNVPWARFGCSDIIDFDGAGTSAATPQVAAAAALWLQKNRAARRRLSASAGCASKRSARRCSSSAKLNPSGNQAPRTRRIARQRCACESAGRGGSAAPDRGRHGIISDSCDPDRARRAGRAAGPQQQMLELEALQLSQSARDRSHHACRSGRMRSPADLRRLAEALAAHPRASKALRAGARRRRAA